MTPHQQVRAAIEALHGLKPEDPCYAKLNTACWALWLVIHGTEMPAMGDPPHVVMAKLIDDVYWLMKQPAER